MAQSDEQIKDSLETSSEAREQRPLGRQKAAQVSKRVSDHLANERTFLAWMRTGLATIAFGFVVERFGLVLRELGFKGVAVDVPIHISSFFGVALTLLGVAMMIVALLNFLHIRKAIDQEEFQPRAWYAIVLTVLASLIGALLAIYLLLTG